MNEDPAAREAEESSHIREECEPLRSKGCAPMQSF